MWRKCYGECIIKIDWVSPENFFDEGETFGFFHTKLQQMSVITQWVSKRKKLNPMSYLGGGKKLGCPWGKNKVVHKRALYLCLLNTSLICMKICIFKYNSKVTKMKLRVTIFKVTFWFPG